MKKLLVILIPAAAMVALVMLAWKRLTGPDAGEMTMETDVPVRVAEIIRTTMRGYVTAYGLVEPEPPGEREAARARVSPRVPGVVVAVRVTEGQQVAKGSVLFELDSRAADIAVEFAKKTLERETQLMETGGTSPKVLQQAQQQLDDARVQQAFLKIASPLDGTVTRVNVAPGEAVDLTSVLAEVVDLDRIVVSANVPVAEVASLEPGQSCEIVVDIGNEAISCELIFIGASVDLATGTVPARVSVQSASGLLPGEFVSVRIVSTEHKDSLAVPVESVSKSEDGEMVVSVVQNGIAVQMPVTTGLHDRGLVEIDGNGLRPGQAVVTEGAYALPNETRVIVIGD